MYTLYKIFDDERLSIEAKAIYVYFALNMDVDCKLTVSVDELTRLLSMTPRRLKTHREALEYYGYITVEKSTQKHGFGCNTYIVKV